MTVYHVRRCPSCEASEVQDRDQDGVCSSCKAVVPIRPPESTNCQFDDYTRKLLGVPFGPESKDYTSAKDVDAALRRMAKQYGHFGQEWGRI